MSTQRIRDLNDALRTALTGGKVMMTASVQALPPNVVAAAIAKMRAFNEFDTDNDPHAEHDFGSFEFAGETFFWTIEYYDKRMEFGSEDPSDRNKTTRVLLLMLASDY
jgi:hypothetical protein